MNTSNSSLNSLIISSLKHVNRDGVVFQYVHEVSLRFSTEESKVLSLEDIETNFFPAVDWLLNSFDKPFILPSDEILRVATVLLQEHGEDFPDGSLSHFFLNHLSTRVNKVLTASSAHQKYDSLPLRLFLSILSPVINAVPQGSLDITRWLLAPFCYENPNLRQIVGENSPPNLSQSYYLDAISLLIHTALCGDLELLGECSPLSYDNLQHFARKHPLELKAFCLNYFTPPENSTSWPYQHSGEEVFQQIHEKAYQSI